MLLCVFALLSSLTDVVRGAGCGPAPVAVTLGNVTLSNSHIARGLEVSVGTPPQPFVFMPQWPMNNSFVYGTNGHCPSDYTTSMCTTFRGGSYDPFASTTREVPDTQSYPVDSSPWASFSMVADTLDLNGTSLDSIPVGVPLNDLGQQGYHPMNGIGLGPNSTLLNTLWSTGQIASRTWSMFWGRNGNAQSSQMEGIFVFGGYDKAKVQNQKYTQALSINAQCPTQMLLTISDMVLNFSNGTDASMFPSASSTALQVCRVPDFPALMTIPYDPFFKNLEALTNETIEERSQGILFFVNRYAPNTTTYTGDLTLKFQSGLQIRIPNDQLIVPDRYIDSSGAIASNLTGLDTTMLAIEGINANDMSILGRQFLSAAYVMLNQDANQFTLWEANPTTDRQLVAVDATDTEVTSTCSASSSASGSASNNSTAPLGSSVGTSQHRTTISGATVAGIAVGGVAALGLVTAGAVLFYLGKLQRRRRPPPEYQPRSNIAIASTYPDTKIYTPDLIEMPAVAPTPRREVAPSQWYQYELQG